MTVQQWVDAYADAWRERDAEAAAALFTEDSSYRSHPLQEAHLGSEGVRSYWETVTATQDAVDVRMGAPVESDDGRRAAVEFWVRMRNERRRGDAHRDPVPPLRRGRALRGPA